jgi:hypothetical protein
MTPWWYRVKSDLYEARLDGLPLLSEYSWHWSMWVLKCHLYMGCLDTMV